MISKSILLSQESSYILVSPRVEIRTYVVCRSLSVCRVVGNSSPLNDVCCIIMYAQFTY
ncbi:hypothetical protein Lalb_Chr14g0363991 [Lupinus albus]|uniref:Uncharacterized protein n=1 Tax=Lupinus albus TaxID=3870 RepID=A0A6A4PEC7_LUPAL|nr:hypothetical protein Lalb_Chr14g0363991 [Lupinus albus]